jgi:hypothetical protein
MGKPSQVIVVLEDGRQRMLIHRYLISCGLRAHQLRIRQSPSGRGSAENWVQKTFVQEATEYRVRQTRAQTALIVMVDADANTGQYRLRQLDASLTDGDKPTVDENERIARLVPRRNVETWILCLNDETVDEETDYKNTRNDWNKLIPEAGETLRQWSRPNSSPPSHWIESLRFGAQELRRLRPAG